MGSILDEILQSPNLPKYKEEIERFWQEEQRTRQGLYQSMEDKSYEFINGKIYEKMSTNAEHNRIQSLLSRLLGIYVDKYQLGRVGVDKLMISLTRNDYEPDICFWNKAIADQFLVDQTLFPAPDFVVEILSKSTEKRDRGIKFNDYAAHGIAEYWLIDPQKQVIEQYKLHKGEFQIFSTSKKAEGVMTSFTIPKFTIPAKAVFDEKSNLETLQNLLAV